jgi:hypothetical protein
MIHESEVIILIGAQDLIATDLATTPASGIGQAAHFGGV